MPYIFLHGLGQAPSCWYETISGLSEQEAAICLDLAGMLRKPIYSHLYQAFSACCDGFSEPLNLCGLSLGAVLALQYAAEHPAKVQSMTLIAAQYKMPGALLALQHAVFYSGRSQVSGFGKQACLRLGASMASLDFSKNLHKVSCPTLLLCGEWDRDNLDASKELAERLPNATFRLVRDAGHAVNIDAPATLAKFLNNLRRIYQPNPSHL